MMFDRDGGLWTGGTGGLVYWDVKKGTYVKYTAEHGLPGNFVNAIAQAPDGSLLFGGQGGLTLIRRHAQEEKPTRVPPFFGT